MNILLDEVIVRSWPDGTRAQVLSVVEDGEVQVEYGPTQGYGLTAIRQEMQRREEQITSLAVERLTIDPHSNRGHNHAENPKDSIPFASRKWEAGLQDLTFHDLRHTFASRLREAGVDAITRRDLLGHSTVEMSEDYTRSSAESRLRAVQSIPAYRKQDYSNFTTNQDSETSVRIAS